MQKQVDNTHYRFDRYVVKPRWASMWHQLDEVLKFQPESVLEIGPGPGVFKAVAGLFGVNVETLDIDPELQPDHVASVFDLPFEEGAFDVVCAFQMLEHLPFERSLQAFADMARVASRGIVISLPDAATRWPMSIYVPKLGPIRFSVPRPRLRRRTHKFDGEHYWEINKSGYPLSYVTSSIMANTSVTLQSAFRVHEHNYHHFLVFVKAD